ncbi:MAG: hypothetical protein FWE27_08075 [Defluviitaleaceae bacterium]|nr:hypothetical protein [Defluviitaleaceae bacterium]
MRKKVILLLVVMLILVPIAIFAASSDGYKSEADALGYMSEAEALAERIRLEEDSGRTRIQGVRIPSEPVQIDVVALEDESEALAERIRLEERTEQTVESIGCTFPHLFHDWGAWIGWYQWGSIWHHSTQCGVPGVFCHREEGRHRICRRCNDWQPEERLNTQFQCR